ncbi:MAG TPA: nitroreductase [Bacteroidia bacterium]|nr:nitroreductase [Bacteroidia bacterium]
METLNPEIIAKKNETLKTIYERRAVRTYLDKPVSKEIIEELLDAGRMAPSAINKQPWNFYVVTNKELIKLFSDEIGKAAAGHYHLAFASGLLKMTDAIFHGAPVVIFITAPKDNDWAPLDIGMCAQNIMLAAKSLGLDTCPVGMGKFIEETKSFSKLKVSGKEKVLLSITIGYGKKTPDAHPRNKKNVTYIE